MLIKCGHRCCRVYTTVTTNPHMIKTLYTQMYICICLQANSETTLYKYIQSPEYSIFTEKMEFAYKKNNIENTKNAISVKDNAEKGFFFT